MSDAPATPRPVSLAAKVAILIGFALFLILGRALHLRRRGPTPQNLAAENTPSNLAWEATPEGRAAYLAQLRASQEKQASTYAWVDQKAGVVQLPIDRAMELTVQAYNTKK